MFLFFVLRGVAQCMITRQIRQIIISGVADTICVLIIARNVKKETAPIP